MNSITRLFFIINRLIESPHTVRELQEKLCKEFNLDLIPSHHAIDDDLNRIKKAGFLYTKNKVGRFYAYKIEKTPYYYSLNQEEVNLIKDLFTFYSNNPIGLNKLFDNISSLLNFDIQEIISKDNYCNFENKEIYPEIKYQLHKAINFNFDKISRVKFQYQSNLKNIRTYSCYPYKIEIDEKRIER